MAILVERFKRWLDKAAPGFEYPYHIGLLALDRWDSPEVPNEISDLANAVYTAFEAGEVSLHQIRLYPEHRGFEYIARKRQPADKLFDLELPARMAETEWAQAVPVAIAGPSLLREPVLLPKASFALGDISPRRA